MQHPSTADTIAAVSSAWVPSPVGILRLTGPESFAAVAGLGLSPPAADRPAWNEGRLTLGPEGSLPATVYWFRAPRSYTGQDVVEIHTVGCLPLLREASARLIEAGVRRALPGEFTARAFLNGKLSAADVDAVLNLMNIEEQSASRTAERLRRDSTRRLAADAVERTTALLAALEAGIDFVEEEDVRLISAAEVAAALEDLIARLGAADAGGQPDWRTGRPHVALAGVPNAGKSTLFNALLGCERALVSPVLGTTRDVLSADVELDGVHAVLQDCAGLGGATDDLELATHLAAERAAQQADLVLWVHASDTPWTAAETTACVLVAADRRLLVRSKVDLAAVSAEPPPIAFAAQIDVSAAAGLGLSALRAAVAQRLSGVGGAAVIDHARAEPRSAVAALRRARGLVGACRDALPSPELVALELREACAHLTECGRAPLDEEVLERIFAQFCVGK